MVWSWQGGGGATWPRTVPLIVPLALAAPWNIQRNLLCLLLPLLTLCLAPFGVHAASSSANTRSDDLFVVSNFTDDSAQSFSHLAVDKNTGSVYVGGVNRLYHFDPNLNLLQSVRTGPVNDSIDCSPSGCPKGTLPASMKLTDNYNKVLVLDYTRSRLIVCGTVSHGSCQVSF